MISWIKSGSIVITLLLSASCAITEIDTAINAIDKINVALGDRSKKVKAIADIWRATEDLRTSAKAKQTRAKLEAIDFNMRGLFSMQRIDLLYFLDRYIKDPTPHNWSRIQGQIPVTIAKLTEVDELLKENQDVWAGVLSRSEVQDVVDGRWLALRELGEMEAPGENDLQRIRLLRLRYEELHDALSHLTDTLQKRLDETS